MCGGGGVISRESGLIWLGSSGGGLGWFGGGFGFSMDCVRSKENS